MNSKVKHVRTIIFRFRKKGYKRTFVLLKAFAVFTLKTYNEYSLKVSLYIKTLAGMGWGNESQPGRYLERYLTVFQSFSNLEFHRVFVKHKT